jgi:hypothetical protein
MLNGSRMKLPLYGITLLLTALVFTACSKNDQEQAEPVAPTDLNGTWQLTSRYNTDSARWLPIVTGDSSYYIFRENGTYVFHTNNYQNEGNYHLSLVDNKIKLVTAEEPAGLQIERLGQDEIRVDAWLFSRVAGHSGRKFIRVPK